MSYIHCGKKIDQLKTVMNYMFTLGLICFVLTALLTVGCARNRPFRTDFNPYSKPHPEEDSLNRAVIEMAPEYNLGFVEFDEEGWFWNPDQAKKVEEMLASATENEGTNSNKAIILLFVHGWKNNAAYNCSNVVMLRKTLVEINHAEQAKNKINPRKVIGIYCGWRGLSASIEPFKELSIWTRKKTAHKVGGHGALTQFLVELEKIQAASNRHLSAEEQRTELIIVGHSFGAAAVYSAIVQFTTERFVNDVEHGRPLKPLGDQVSLKSGFRGISAL
jgi:hypothetical protein